MKKLLTKKELAKLELRAYKAKTPLRVYKDRILLLEHIEALNSVNKIYMALLKGISLNIQSVPVDQIKALNCPVLETLLIPQVIKAIDSHMKN